MKEKVVKTILVTSLIMVLTMFDFILLGQNIVIAIAEELEAQGLATNIKNVEFDVYVKEGERKAHSKQTNIKEGDNLILNIAVKEAGVLEAGKITIKNSNFKLQETQNQHVKSIHPEINEIELNQVIVGNQEEISIPIAFQAIEEMNKEYLSQEVQVKLTGTYKNGENENKFVEGERSIKIDWVEEEELQLGQEIEKFIDLEGNKTLLQQKINTQIINNTLVNGKIIETVVPEIENALPEAVAILMNGKQIGQENYTYDLANKMVTIQNVETNNKENDEYKVIYTYPKKIEAETISVNLNTKMKASLYTEEVVEKEEVKDVEVVKTNNRVLVTTQATESGYKGYFYANADKNMTYQEKINMEISTLDKAGEIEINQMHDYFVDQNGIKSEVNRSSYISQIRFDKDNLQNILGEEFWVRILGEEDQILGEINKESEITVNLEEKIIGNIRIQTSRPTNIGTLSFEMERYVKGQTGYSKDQLKTFTALENTKVATMGEETIAINSKVLLLDTCTEARIQISNTKFSNINKNENVQMLAILKSDSEKYDLYKNPYVEIKLPEELQEIEIHSIDLLYADGLALTNTNYIADTKTLQMKLEGEQNNFKTAVEEGVQISINADLTFYQNIPNRESVISMTYTNENAQEAQYQTSTKISINSKHGAILYNKITGYNEENTVVETTNNETLKAKLDSESDEKQATIDQSFINNYELPIDQVSIVGKLAGEKSDFETSLVQNITTNDENVKVYYSNKENAIAEDDSWQGNVENMKEVKSYKIELNEELQPAEIMNISYQVNIPAQLEEGAQNYQTTDVSYSYRGQRLNLSSDIQLFTNEMPKGIVTEKDGITTEIVAMSANKQLTEGEEIFEGQPISYTVKVTNKTGADLNQFELIAEHTNVIYYVVTEKEGDILDHEGAEPTIVKFTKKDENAKNVTQVLETLKNEETAIFTYQVSPKKREGVDITGTLKMKATNLEEKTFNTITNKIKDAKIAVEILNGLEENCQIYENDIVPFRLNITNNSGEVQKDVILTIQTSENLVPITEEGEIVAGLGYEVINWEDHTMTLKIPTLEVTEEPTFFNMVFMVDQLENKETEHDTSIYYTARLGEETYFSNTITRSAKRATARLEARQRTDVKGNTVKIGDKIIYTAEISNNDPKLSAENITMQHEVTEGNAKIENAYLKKANGETVQATIEETNEAEVEYTLNPGEKAIYTAEVILWDNPDEEVNYEETVTSNMYLSWYKQGTLAMNQIEYQIADENGNNGGNDDNHDPEKNDKKSISGTAWIDRNKDGKRDESEKSISDLAVALLNSNTGEVIQSNKTNQAGKYQFNNLDEGDYMVTFAYNSSVYSITQYQKEGIEEDRNSDVIAKEVNGETVAMTDTLRIEDSSLENIDAGFVQNKKFDFSLNKTISKVIVQNGEGTRKTEYNKAKLAKVEIHAKHMVNSTVLVEYEIEVKNEGEIQGYVNEIVDYMPKDLKFSSEINKDWYIGTDGNIHNISLSNSMIKPGESKIVTLTLSKQMTTENTGRSVNIAEIASTSNELLVIDEDSTPGNRKDGEDDISTAELLISVKTGMVTISISISVVLILISMAYIIYRKRKGGK